MASYLSATALVLSEQSCAWAHGAGEKDMQYSNVASGHYKQWWLLRGEGKVLGYLIKWGGGCSWFIFKSRSCSGMLSHSVVSKSLRHCGLCRPPGSSFHGILRARLPCSPPEDLADPGIQPESPMSHGRWVLYHSCHVGSPKEAAGASKQWCFRSWLQTGEGSVGWRMGVTTWGAAWDTAWGGSGLVYLWAERDWCAWNSGGREVGR